MLKSTLLNFTSQTHASYFRVAASGVVALAIVVAAPLSAFAQSGSIGGRPANPDPSNARTQSIFVKTIQPGASVEDAVQIVNNTGVKKSILVYATDSVVSSGGAFACAQAADEQKNVGQWIKVSQSTIDIDANGTIKVPFTVAAPANAEPGEQNGCIIIQEQKESNFQTGVSLNFRTAIRVAILLPGDIKKEISTQGLTTSQKNGKVIVSPSVKNTGNVSVDTDITTTIKSVFGSTESSQTSTYPVLRGELTSWNFEMDTPFWGGFYTASYSATYDASKNFIGSSANKELKTIAGQSKTIFVFPQILALLVELLILAGIATASYFLYRHLQHKKAVKDWKDYTIKSDDNLQIIAKKQKISWKLLAKENGIKAPYILQTDQIIKVPGKANAAKRTKTKK